MFFLDEVFQLQNYVTVHAFVIIKSKNIQMLCDIPVGYLQSTDCDKFVSYI